jgi:TRAP-type C4-dicarboxylate transport system substrate-binding protein
MKFRTAENPLIVDWFGALGANPVVVSINEVFTALQQGVMDGVYTTITMMAQTKTYEVAKEITSLNNTLGMTFLVMNLDKFNSLTPEQQATMEEAGRAYIAAQREASMTETERVVAEMEATGAVYYSLNAEEVIPFREAVEPVYDKWRSQIGEAYFAETEEYIANWSK